MKNKSRWMILSFGIIILFVVSTVSPMVIGYKSVNGDPFEKSIIPLIEEPGDHIWHQQGYNCQHLGRSPYSTENTLGVEKWRFPAGDWCDGSPSIGPDGSIYFGSDDGYLYAVYSNGIHLCVACVINES